MSIEKISADLPWMWIAIGLAVLAVLFYIFKQKPALWDKIVGWFHKAPAPIPDPTITPIVSVPVATVVPVPVPTAPSLDPILAEFALLHGITVADLPGFINYAASMAGKLTFTNILVTWNAVNLARAKR